MKSELFKIELPIFPKDVFRLLALRSINAPDLFHRLLISFNELSVGITQTPRLDPKEFGRPAFSYTHSGNTVAESNFRKMTERQLCSSPKAFFGNEFECIGRVIDYELPLDDKKDSAFGKVDLVSITKAGELLLLEVKKVESNEHPLRAMFEIFTFWKTLADNDGKFSSFMSAYSKCDNFKSQRCEIAFDKVFPGLLLCSDSDIMNSLIGCKDDGTDESELYKRFLADPIGLRIFSYTKERLEVEEKTKVIKDRLGIKTNH